MVACGRRNAHEAVRRYVASYELRLHRAAYGYPWVEAGLALDRSMLGTAKQLSCDLAIFLSTLRRNRYIWQLRVPSGAGGRHGTGGDG